MQIKATHDDRGHTRTAVIRDLFGIAEREVLPLTPSKDEGELAQIRALPTRAAARGARLRPAADAHRHAR